MKNFKKFLLGLAALVLILFVPAWLWLKSTAPQYEGTLELAGLQSSVEIVYDDFGVPHIYASNAHDAYFALGYAQTQERLFQMEMIRRATSGRLAEILGEDLLTIDKIMRTLSIRKFALQSAQNSFANASDPFKKQSLAYLEGINSFIDNGTLPVEFTLIGFEPEHFRPEDIYTAIGYMSLSFTAAISLDPMMTGIREELGEDYLRDLALDSLSNAALYHAQDRLLSGLFKPFALQEMLPVPIWEGSNNWVMGKHRSASGKVLLANDTHIAYSQPAVWFEAHLNYPGFEMFGYYLAGIPFALMGHNRHYGWGLTIFPFDNMDLYLEKTKPGNSGQYRHGGEWLDFEVDEQHIPVKDGEDVPFSIRSSIHGPELNPVYTHIAETTDEPVCLWWSLHHIETTALKALYGINNAKNLNDFEQAMKRVDIIGLNVVYGASDDNIAWWAAGKIPVRTPQINTMLMLDGSDTANDFKGFYSFDKNPKRINPPGGFIGTSNNAPIPVDGTIYPGYYFPGYRARRIRELAESHDHWDLGSMRSIQLDVKSDRDLKIRNLVMESVDADALKNQNELYARALDTLAAWDGNYTVESSAATLYTSMLYHILKQTMADELGDERFDKIVSTVPLRSAVERLFFNPQSPWWDDVRTHDEKESREEQLAKGLQLALEDLAQNPGGDLSAWRWGKLHTLTHVHPIGRKEPFDKVFNVGPFPKNGGNEVVDKEAFNYNGHGPYPVISGPAMRLLLDFGSPEKALSILPTGQSGNVMSPHYDDQAQMFVNGEYRTRQLNRADIPVEGVLVLKPGK